MGTGMKVAGIVGVLAVLGGGCAAAYAFSDTVKNQVKLRTSSPEDYYQWVCEKNISDLADGSAAAYQKALDRSGDNPSASISVQYTPSDAVKDLILSSAGGDETVESVVRNINTVEMDTGVVTGGSTVAEQFRLIVNDTEVTTAEATADTSDNTIFLRVPELSERWIQMPNIAAEANVGLMMAPKDYLSASECSDLVTRYMSIVPAHVSTVTVEKKQEVQIGDISTNYIAMTADLSPDELVSMLTEFTDKAGTDETLLKMVPDADEFSGAMMDGGDALRQLADMCLGSDTVPFTTYVDATGTIRGFYTAPVSGTAFFAAVGMDNGQVAGALKCSVMNKSLINFKLSSDLSGTGNYTGSVYASEDESLSFSGDFHDIKLVNDKGYVSGDFSFSVNESEPFKITLTTDGSTQTAECNVNFEGTDYGTVRVSYTDKSDITVPEPDRSGAYVMDENTNFNIADYTNQSSLTTYVSNVLQRIGVDEETAKQAALSLGAMFYLFQ